MFGVRMRNVEDTRIAEVVDEEIINDLMAEKDEIREEARRNIQKIQDENRKSYNRRRKKATMYRVGDIVAIKKTQFGAGIKIMPKYLGPYKVTKTMQNERYAVEKIGESPGPMTTRTSADNMKPWRSTFPDYDEDDDSEEEDGQSFPDEVKENTASEDDEN